MAINLTYDPANDPETIEAEDQRDAEALEIGEKLAEEQNELLAGKYKDAEELEKAYIELQKKLGSSEEETEEDPSTLDEQEEEWSDGASVIIEASDEYYANEGQLSAETMQKFTEMSSTDLVNAYMEIQANAPEQTQAESPDLTDAEMNSVYNSAGGEAEYEKLTSWAAENLAENKLDAFNSIIDRGDATAIQIAVAGLRSEYENQEGYEGRMLTGKGARATDGFRSQAEVVAAMNDPRYDRDEAYRQDVYDKLERSNVAF